MPSSTESKDSEDLRHRAGRLTIKLCDLAARHFDAEFATPSVRFDLRGMSAGQMRITDGGNCLIRYNARLLERHPRTFLSQTVPHETAHLVAFSLFGPQVPPHGREWRAVMALFGASPERCHSYRVDGLQVRHLRRYAYRCACACCTHQLTSIRHNRIKSGQIYRCRQCGQPLECSSV